mgnify:CR=1 FL=1
MAMSYPLSLATTTKYAHDPLEFSSRLLSRRRTSPARLTDQMEAHVPVVMIPIHVRIVGRHLR